MEKNKKIIIGGIIIILLAIAAYFTFFGAQEKTYTEDTQGAINVKKEIHSKLPSNLIQLRDINGMQILMKL